MQKNMLRFGTSFMMLLVLAGCETLGLEDSNEEKLMQLGPKRLPAYNAGERTTSPVMMEKAMQPTLGYEQAKATSEPYFAQSAAPVAAPSYAGSELAFNGQMPEYKTQNEPLPAVKMPAPAAAVPQQEEQGFWGRASNFLGITDEHPAPQLPVVQESALPSYAQAKPYDPPIVGQAQAAVGDTSYPLLNDTPNAPVVEPLVQQHAKIEAMQQDYQSMEQTRQAFMQKGEDAFVNMPPANLPEHIPNVEVSTQAAPLQHAMPMDAAQAAAEVAPVKVSAPTYQPPVARIATAPNVAQAHLAEPKVSGLRMPDVRTPVLPTPQPAPSARGHVPMVNGKPSVLPPPPSAPVALTPAPALQRMPSITYAPQPAVRHAAPQDEMKGTINMPPANVPTAGRTPGMAPPVASVPAPPMPRVSASSGLPSPSSFDDEVPSRGSRLLSPSRYSDRYE